jgi:3-oxoacyl-[acyl-carrier-protein] synthase II
VEKRVVITGIGCISPVGNDVDTAWHNLLTGNSGVSKISAFDATDFKVQIAGEIKDFDGVALFGRKDARRMDLCNQYSLAATMQAIDHAGLEITDENRDRIGVLVGTGIGGVGTLFENTKVFLEAGPSRVSPFMVPMMLPDTSAGLIAIHFGVRGPNMSVVTACATGTNAIGEAAEMIRRGQADVIIAGGVEAAIIPIAIAGMGVIGALSTRNDEPERASRPFDSNRDGFVMGEGAGILILESLEFARDRQANILAEVAGYGSTNDAYHISAPAENGAGAAKCMQNALDYAGLEPSQIGYINAHGTSTPLNDKSETAAIKTVFGDYAYSTPISSTKSMTGHLLGAAGALEAIVCVKVLQDGILPPTINYETPDPECDLDYTPNQARQELVEVVMSNSFGFGGHNATIILKRYSEN